jgi:hypothetical protein
MTRKSIYFLLTVIVAIAAVITARQRALNSLRVDNDSLRKQVDLAESARVAAAPEPPAVAGARLGDADERELLRLRSRIVPLREQLRDASNSLAVFQRSQEYVASADMLAAARNAIDTNVARLEEAMSRYLREHDGKPPGDLAAAVRGLDPNLPAAFIRRFELLTTNTANCIAWEKQPEPWPGGGWIRVFVTTNGEANRLGPYPEEWWAGWESNHPAFLTAGKNE